MLELADHVQTRLKSKKSKKYLRCNKQGGVDATAGKSPDSVFLIHRIDANTIKLQSCENSSKWLGWTEQGLITDKGKGDSSTFMVKYHERGVLTLSPGQYIDWHVGCDSYGKLLPCQEVGHTEEAAFEIELVSANLNLQ